MLDDTTRRQLRFSVFLQGFAALMLAGASAVRLTRIGFDPVTAVLLVGLVLVIGAIVFTVSKLRTG